MVNGILMVEFYGNWCFNGGIYMVIDGSMAVDLYGELYFNCDGNIIANVLKV